MPRLRPRSLALAGSRLLGCDAKTIRQGREDFEAPVDSVVDGVRKKGVAPQR